MSNAKALHQLIGGLVQEYPDLAVLRAEIAEVKIPDHDQLEAAPNRHRVRGRREIETDSTVRMRHNGTARFFAQVEMQRKYTLEKLTTLRAYHGSEVRNSGCGGHMFVLSPGASVARRFQREEERLRGELAFQVTYLSGDDLEPLAAPGRPLHARVTAVALADLVKSKTDRAVSLLLEMVERGLDHHARVFFEAMLEECPDDRKLEEALSELAMERLDRLPTARAWLASRTAAERAEAASARQEAEAARAQAAAAREQAAAALEGLRGILLGCFAASRETLSLSQLAKVKSCSDGLVLEAWVRRALNDETAGQILGALEPISWPGAQRWLVPLRQHHPPALRPGAARPTKSGP